MSRLSKLLRFLLMLLTPLMMTLGAPAWANTGVIKGVTVDEGGLPIPGVNVTISSPALIGGAQQQVTDPNGRFNFQNLAPGIYELLAEKPNFQTIKRTNLQVLIGRNTIVTVEMSVQVSDDVMEVTDERPAVDVESAQKGQVLTKEFLERIPTGRDYLSALSSTPGVLGTGNPNVGGAAYNENTYVLDGVNVTDPVTGTFSMNFNYDAIEQLKVITGAYDAEYPQNLGGIVEIVTETGSNVLEFDTNIWASSAAFSPQYDARFTADGVELAPTGFDSQFDDYQISAKVSGPIIRDRAWFIISYTAARSLIANVGIDLPRDYEGHYILSKLSVQPNAAHRFTVLLQSDPTTIDNTYQSDRFVYPEAQTRQAQGGALVSFQWDWFINPDLIGETKLTVQKSYIEASGVPCTHDEDLGYHPCQPGEEENSLDRITPGRYGSFNAFNSVNAVSYQFDDRWRVNGETKWKLLQRQFFGSHDLKAGVSFDYLVWDWIVGYNGNMYFVDLNEVTFDPDTFKNYYWIETSYPFHQIQRGLVLGGFVQDVYKPIDNLTFRYGLRVDYSRMNSDQGIPVINQAVLGPRLYVIWDPWGDEKTAIRGGYGRFNSLGQMSVAYYLSQSGFGSKLFLGEFFDGFTNTATDVYDVSPNENLITSHDVLTTPHTDEFSVGAQREVIQDVALGASFTAKFTRNLYVFDETNVIWDEDGFNNIGASDGSDDLLYRLRTPTASRRDYYETELSLQKNFSDRWLAQGSYIYAVSRGTVLTSGSAGATLAIPPQAELSYGNLSTDIRHQLKVSAAYDLPNDPWTTQIGTQFQYYSGYPVSRYYYSGYYGSVSILQQPLGTYARAEPRYYFDILVQQAIDVPKGQMTLIAQLENAINAQQADGLNGSYLYYQNRWVITSRQTPLRGTLGLQYKF